MTTYIAIATSEGREFPQERYKLCENDYYTVTVTHEIHQCTGYESFNLQGSNCEKILQWSSSP
jgi:hypothetical protein